MKIEPHQITLTGWLFIAATNIIFWTLILEIVTTAKEICS